MTEDADIDTIVEDDVDQKQPLESQAFEEDPPKRYQELSILALSVIFGMSTWFSASVIVPQLRVIYGLSATSSSLLTIMVQIGFVVGALSCSVFNLIDVLMPRKCMLIGSLGASLWNILIIVYVEFWWTLLMRFLTGAFLALVYPPAMKAMAMWFKKGRGLALGVMVGAVTIGSALPNLVTGFGGLSWKIVLIVTSVVTLFGGLIAYFVSKDGPYPFAKSNFDIHKTTSMLKDEAVLYACLGYLGHMWELYACWAWLYIFYSEIIFSHDSSFNFAAFTAFGVIAIGAVGSWFGGFIADKYLGRTTTVIICLLCSGICSIVIGFTRNYPALSIVVGLVWGFWVVADSAQFSTMIIEVATNQSLVGTALSIQMATGYMLTVLTIFMIPLLFNRFSFVYAFAFLGFGPLVGICAMLRLKQLPQAKKIAGGKT